MQLKSAIVHFSTSAYSTNKNITCENSADEEREKAQFFQACNITFRFVTIWCEIIIFRGRVIYYPIWFYVISKITLLIIITARGVFNSQKTHRNNLGTPVHPSHRKTLRQCALALLRNARDAWSQCLRHLRRLNYIAPVVPGPSPT